MEEPDLDAEVDNKLEENELQAQNPFLPQMPNPGAQAVEYRVEDIQNDRKEIYRSLIWMFPNKNKNYIRKLLIQPPFDTSTFDETTLSATFVKHIHEHPNEGNLEDFPEYVAEQVAAPTRREIDELCKNLQEILPNADPTYLYEIAINSIGTNRIDEFIEESLMHHAYPTKQQCQEREKMSKIQKQYTSDFDVKSFLAVVPDPFAYFEDPKRQDVFRNKALAYLRNEFRSIKINTIKEIYENSNYNLSVTAKTLANTKPNMVSRRVPIEEDVNAEEDDMPMLKELAFLRNKRKIRKHFSKVRKKEKREYNECKLRGTLLECQNCYVTELIPSKTTTCPKEHVFCKPCVKAGIDHNISNGIYTLQCFMDCKSEFTSNDLQQVMTASEYTILQLKKQEIEISAAKIEGLEFCPFCNYALIPPEADKIFTCLNPDCMKETCRNCKLINHLPEKCKKEIEADEARVMIEEKMTQALVRTCENCKKSFCKDDNGCNHIVCSCGANLCYICNKIIEDGYNHFRAQGSERFDLCPLFTDDNKMDAEFVRKIAMETKEKLKITNPEIDVEIESLLPEIPVATSGPHESVLQAHEDPVKEFIRIRNEVLEDSK